MIENPMVLADPEPERYPECPLCENECEKIYLSDEGEVLGCEHCVSENDSREWLAEYQKYGLL